MTNEVYLRACGLTDEDINEMREMGYSANRFDNVSALNELTFKYLDAGMMDKAAELQEQKNGAIEYIQSTVKDIADHDIVFIDTLYNGAGGWYDQTTNRFVGKLEFDYTLNDTAYNQAILAKFGEL